MPKKAERPNRTEECEGKTKQRALTTTRPPGVQTGLSVLLSVEERRVITEEATESERPLPCIPKWARTAVLAYAAKVDHANWPADRSDVRKFAQTMRRTEETLASAHDTDRVTLRWLAIAWGKRKGFVHQGLNRHDLHGREIPYWTSAMLWDIQGDKPAPPLAPEMARHPGRAPGQGGSRNHPDHRPWDDT